MLSCECDYAFDFDYGDWMYMYEDNEYLIPLDTPKRKRCVSCDELINIGSICSIYTRYRYPYNEIEERITGADLNDEPGIRMANHYHCEKCAEIWLNLTDIGYECLPPSENMVAALKEYHEITGFGR